MENKKFSVFVNKTENFVLYYKNGLNKNTISVPKKIEKKAVKRNRIRRRIKEIVRKRDRKEYLIIVLKKNIIKMKFNCVKDELNILLKNRKEK